MAPAARRGRKKKTTTLIPHQVAAVVPESAYFSQLLDFERRIDQVIARRTVDIKEVCSASLHPPWRTPAV